MLRISELVFKFGLEHALLKVISPYLIACDAIIVHFVKPNIRWPLNTVFVAVLAL